MSTDSTNNRVIFKQAVKGQRPSATEHNKITSTLSKLTASPNTHQKHYAKIRLAKLVEELGRFRNDNSDLELDRSARALAYRAEDASSEPGDHFPETERNNYTNICDPFDLVYGADEKLLILYSEQAGKFYPLNPRTVRHAITCRDASNNYPARSSMPDTYPIKFVRLEFNEAPGAQGRTLSYLRDASGEDAFVHNLIDSAIYDSYLPVGTELQCYNVVGKEGRGQWFTVFSSPIEDSSLSLSESSFSESAGSTSSFSRSTSSKSSASSFSESRSFSSGLSVESVSSQSSFSRSTSSQSASSISVSSSSEDDAIIHRGELISQIIKGGNGLARRYSPGTDDISGTQDTVYNSFATVGAGKVVAYAKIGNKFYLIAAECPMT